MPTKPDEKIGVLCVDSLKGACQDSDKSQKVISNNVNKLLETHNIEHVLHPQRLNGLLKGDIKTLQLHEGLALATVLNRFMTDFVNEEVLELGNFEVKIMDFQLGSEFDEDLRKREKGCLERICAYATFPSYPYRKSGKQEGNQEQKAIYECNEARFQQIKNSDVHTYEFFTIDSLLNFLFSPISPISNEQKIVSLDRMLEIFEKNNTPHQLRFFSSSNPYPRTFASMEIFRGENLLYMSIPVSKSILAIKSQIICDKIRLYLQNQTECEMTSSVDSVDLLKRGEQLLETSCFPTIEQAHQFFDNFSPKIKKLMNNACPHLFRL